MFAAMLGHLAGFFCWIGRALARVIGDWDDYVAARDWWLR